MEEAMDPAPTLDTGNTAWLLASSALVLMMTIPGLALFYAGLVRAKNALSLFMQCMVSAGVVGVLWIIVGYTLAFGTGNAFIGDLSKFGLAGIDTSTLWGTYGIPEYLFVMFQAMFAIITPALMIGAFAERMRFGPYLAFITLWLLLVYCPLAHMVWGGGWIGVMGAKDFAGGLVVHMSSGFSALVLALLLGKRKGFGKDPMPPHSVPLCMIGAGLLWAGWFGFNAGSAFEASTRAAGALLATQVAACAGAMFWGLCEYVRRGQWSVLGSFTGAIAGLVGVTPASGFVGIDGALIIGSVTGVVCFFAVVHFKAKTGIDDSLDVFALHGVGGLVGTLLTPALATAAVAPITATVWTNALGALTVMAYAGGATWLILKLIGMVLRLRVDAESEKVGLDVAQHGEMLAPNA
jgi:Amt family ammonium transporter